MEHKLVHSAGIIAFLLFDVAMLIVLVVGFWRLIRDLIGLSLVIEAVREFRKTHPERYKALHKGLETENAELKKGPK